MANKFDRVFVIVLDSLGIGEMKDASDFNDIGANTFGHIAEKVKLNIPILESLGWGLLGDFSNIKKVSNPVAYVTRLEEMSKGKDTMTGHLELMGLVTLKPFKTFISGFPKELMDELYLKSGYHFIGNYAESGTKILEDLGEESIKTNKPIIYTSADSVLQIAAHEKYFGLSNLYKVCEVAREITLKDEYKIGRIIARPFLGENKSSFKRTSNRHDYALSPSGKTYLDYLKDEKLDVISVGKIYDIFNGAGLTESNKIVSNIDGMLKTIEIAKRDFDGLCFVNLVDFDMEYGHRRDYLGYAKAIEDFDQQLKDLIEVLRNDDLLIITADHGNDPTYIGTDHTREYVPFIAYSKLFLNGGIIDEGSFGDVGATIVDNFNINTNKLSGRSRLKDFKFDAKK